MECLTCRVCTVASALSFVRHIIVTCFHRTEGVLHSGQMPALKFEGFRGTCTASEHDMPLRQCDTRDQHNTAEFQHQTMFLAPSFRAVLALVTSRQ
jgi:hypothetical protein